VLGCSQVHHRYRSARRRRHGKLAFFQSEMSHGFHPALHDMGS
jgi:hypothetical protein